MTAISDDLALLTDLYQLTMAASYFAEGMTGLASFSFFIRAYPAERGYLVAAGLEDVVRHLERFHFGADALRHLQRSGRFAAAFLDYLEQLRFTGDVWAVPEGSVCFVPEPLLEVTAPLIEAQLVETALINQLNLQTMIASKAARCVHAAAGRTVVDFSLRRTHGSDAGLKVARASYLAGCSGSSNVLAEQRYGIPAVGTMAHAYVESFTDELQAFRAFVRTFPANGTLLVDTYDVGRGVRHAVTVGREMAARGQQLSGIRIDSGDLFEHSAMARRLLDAAGLRGVKIVVSGSLNEHRIADLVARGAPIDIFGVGTEMGVSGDAPWLDCAYKLVEYAGQPRLKLSAGKETLIGCKQVWRAGAGGCLSVPDVIALRDEPAAVIAAQLGVDAGTLQPRLAPIMRGGRLVEPLPQLESIRTHHRAEWARLPEEVTRLRSPRPWPVTVSVRLQREQQAASASIRSRVV
jgi:nicotinate phosphoribosyltransferase